GSLNISGSVTTTGNLTVNGNATIGGTLTAQEYHTEFVSASIIFSSGSTIFVVSSLIMIVLGALTFIFQSKTFFYIKPTIIYGFFAALLAGGLLSGRTFLKSAFDGAFDMPEAAWRTLSWRFIGFLVVAAVMNEIFWRTLTAGCAPDAFCDGEGTWVKIKSFGYPIASFAFIAANMPFIMKHTAAEEEGDKA
ncbi:inner membrane-spanning protein YciB, partial [Parvularcula marina]|uniref:inner membrane-spanning protein YciB n=1 Tax=Parvularcula marina TaxID=2292771 RepID=UPI003511E65C